MDLEQISPNLNSFFILLGKIRQDPGDLPHFCIIKIVNTIASLVFFVLGVFLIVAFILNREVEEELQEAANFDLWGLFILSSGSDLLDLAFFSFLLLCQCKYFACLHLIQIFWPRDFVPGDSYNILHWRFEGPSFISFKESIYIL